MKDKIYYNKMFYSFNPFYTKKNKEELKMIIDEIIEQKYKPISKLSQIDIFTRKELIKLRTDILYNNNDNFNYTYQEAIDIIDTVILEKYNDDTNNPMVKKLLKLRQNLPYKYEPIEDPIAESDRETIMEYERLLEQKSQEIKQQSQEIENLKDYINQLNNNYNTAMSEMYKNGFNEGRQVLNNVVYDNDDNY